MSAHTRNMTQGSPLKLIISFAIPLMLGNVFQQLYTVMDTLIVGRSLGVDALAALGATDWLVWLVLGIITGFTQGFSIRMAQDYGAGRMEELKKDIGHSILLSLFWSVILMLAALPGGIHVLRFLQTPEEILPLANTYMTILFVGIPLMMLYNFLSSVLRALGDGRTPLSAMIAASFVNIFLDLFFILVCHMGVAGAALGTLLAQLTASLFCLRVLLKSDFFKLTGKDFVPEPARIGKLLYLGLPVAFQNSIIAIGGMVVQFVVNGFGVIFIAGFTATNKLYGILEMAATSYGFAMMTYTGQNLGAGKNDRIKHGVHTAVGIGILTSVLISACMLLFGRTIVGAFISGTAEQTAQATAIAYHYLKIMSLFLSTLYLLHIYRSALQGMGDTIMPMISGLAECFMRIGAALVLPLFWGEQGIFYAEILAWIGADCILLTSYYIRLRKLYRQ